MLKGIIIGYIGADAQVLEREDKSVVRFSISPRQKKSDKDEKSPSWITCFLNHTLSLLPFLKKGTLVYVEGDLTQGVFMKDDGSAIPSNTITVQKMELLSPKKENEI